MKLLVIAALFALALTAVLFAQDRSTSGDEIQVKQLERSWDQAEAKQDVSAVSALLADSLTYTDYDGSFMNKSEYLRSITAQDQKPDHLYDEGLSVRIFGNAAVATGTFRETGSAKGKPYTRHARFTDTWVKQSGIWQCVASQSTLIPSK